MLNHNNCRFWSGDVSSGNNFTDTYWWRAIVRTDTILINEDQVKLYGYTVGLNITEFISFNLSGAVDINIGHLSLKYHIVTLVSIP